MSTPSQRLEVMGSPATIFVYINSAAHPKCCSPASPHPMQSATPAAAQLLWHTRRVSHPAPRPNPRVASHHSRSVTAPALHSPCTALPSRCTATPLHSPRAARPSAAQPQRRTAQALSHTPRLRDDKGSNLWVRAEGTDNSDDKYTFLKTMPSLFEDRPHTPHNPPRRSCKLTTK